MKENSENTPPHSSYENLEEELVDAGDVELINFNEIEEIPDDEDCEIDMDAEDYADDDFIERIPERDDAQLTFKNHLAPVFCCNLHPTEDLAVTGGEDDRAFVWNTKTGEVIYEVKNHKDTVITAAFSYDGNYLATGDMAGEIQVFKVHQDYKKVWEFSMGDMCWLKWHIAANVLLAGGDTGEIYVWRIPSGDCKILPGNGQRCETADLANDGKKLFAGYGDGCLKLWDIKNSSTIVEINSDDPNSHTECVSGVSCDSEKSLYMSGSEDGKILLISNSGVVGSLDPGAGPVEAVSFCPDVELKVAASGTLHGQIAIWDVTKQTIRTICEYNEPDDGVTTLKWLPEQTLLCGTIRGNIFGFDGRSGERKFELQGHVSEIYDTSFNKKDNILLTASEDSTAKIFKIST